MKISQASVLPAVKDGIKNSWECNRWGKYTIELILWWNIDLVFTIIPLPHQLTRHKLTYCDTPMLLRTIINIITRYRRRTRWSTVRVFICVTRVSWRWRQLFCENKSFAHFLKELNIYFVSRNTSLQELSVF